MLHQRRQTTVESLPNRRGPPNILEVHLGDHHGTFALEVRATEFEDRQLTVAGIQNPPVSARDQTEIALIDRGREHQPGYTGR